MFVKENPDRKKTAYREKIQEAVSLGKNLKQIKKKIFFEIGRTKETQSLRQLLHVKCYRKLLSCSIQCIWLTGTRFKRGSSQYKLNRDMVKHELRVTSYKLKA